MKRLLIIAVLLFLCVSGGYVSRSTAEQLDANPLPEGAKPRISSLIDILTVVLSGIGSLGTGGMAAYLAWDSAKRWMFEGATDEK